MQDSDTFKFSKSEADASTNTTSNASPNRHSNQASDEEANRRSDQASDEGADSRADVTALDDTRSIGLCGQSQCVSCLGYVWLSLLS
jgi:hypothetical protein